MTGLLALSMTGQSMMESLSNVMLGLLGNNTGATRRNAR